MQPTYDELLAENKWLREQNSKTEKQVLDELVQLLLADDKPLVKVSAEGYEYRLYELEVEFMMQKPDTPESKAAWASCERVKANYLAAYPDRPLNPKPRPNPADSYQPTWYGPPAKPRKPYTKRTPPTT